MTHEYTIRDEASPGRELHLTIEPSAYGVRITFAEIDQEIVLDYFDNRLKINLYDSADADDVSSQITISEQVFPGQTKPE